MVQRLLSRVGFALSLVLGLACGGGDGGGASTCVPGDSQSCACTDGRQGAQVCGADGTYEACVCEGQEGPDASVNNPADASSVADASVADASLMDASVADARPPLAIGDEVYIAAGSFTMGCNLDVCQFADELPSRTVTLSAYYIDWNEVTHAQYQACIDAGDCTPPNVAIDAAGTPNQPVRGVTWTQATGYCVFAGRRLPTEAEWEKAARGADGRMYPWGVADPTCDLADYDGCDPPEPADVATHPMGESPYGIQDMGGNVWEWVSDYYDPDYYMTAPDTDPENTTEATTRVIRGGDFDGHPSFMRTFNRNGNVTTWNEGVGFRCARDGA